MVYHQHHLKVGIFLVFLLANAAKIQQVQGDENGGGSETGQTLSPYLDEAGNLCQDKLETIQDTEYETMIQCRVAMKKTCSNQKSADNAQEQVKPNEACHTVYDKNCKTVYRPHRSKVRVRVCPDGNVNVANSPFRTNTELDELDNENNIVLDVRPNPRLPSPQIAKKCHKGRRTICTTKYHTECTTQQVQQTMQEDHPKCQVEMVERCPSDESENSKCLRVPKMSCKIEKRTVVKTKPESKCSRVPRQFCRKEDCSQKDEEENLYNDDPNCYYRNQIVNEILPEEKCSLIPKQMCHPVEPEEEQNSVESLRKRRSADHSNPLSMLRRHYLSRNLQNNQMLPRKSRNFNQRKSSPLPLQQSTTTENKNNHTQQVCKMSPEQVCEKKRINPRIVEKKMTKKFCRKPKKDSYFDQYLVAKLSRAI